MVKTFTLKRASALLVTLFISLMATAQTVTYDFAENPWHVEDGPNSYYKEGVELVQDGVVMTHIKGHPANWNRLKDGELLVYRNNGFRMKAPAGKVITHIDILHRGTNHLVDAENKALKASTSAANTVIWDGKSADVTITGTRFTTNIKKIVLTLEDDTTTGIAQVENTRKADGKVYNLNGVQVGTAETFNTLPKGIYIVNGKKVVK